MQKMEIEIHIAKDGKVTMQPKGMKGPGCLDETKALEEALGKVTSREHTSEYFETVEQEAETVIGKHG
jgi:hypothetical protein